MLSSRYHLSLRAQLRVTCMHFPSLCLLNFMAEDLVGASCAFNSCTEVRCIFKYLFRQYFVLIIKFLTANTNKLKQKKSGMIHYSQQDPIYSCDFRI